jgi:hypothetical protein
VSDTNALKLLEAGTLLAALGLFVWWQLRDLKRAAAETARKRAQSEDAQSDSHGAPKGDA